MRRADSQGSDPAVVRRICTEIPELAGANVKAEQLVTRLRDWTFRNTPVVLPDAPESVSLLAPSDTWRVKASDCVEMLAINGIGVWCAGTAWLLMQIYDAFGLESYTYNYGYWDATHVVTLVRVEGRLVVQDAFFNYDLRDRDGQLLDVVAVLAHLRDHEHDQVVMVEQQPFPRRALLMVDETHARLPDASDAAFVTRAQVDGCRRSPTGHWRCEATAFRWERVPLRAWGAAALERLAADGLPPRLEYLMAYPLGVSSSRDGWTTLERNARATPTSAVLHRLWSALEPV